MTKETRKIRILNEDAVLCGLTKNEVLISFLEVGSLKRADYIVSRQTLQAICRRLKWTVGVLLVGEKNIKEHKIEINSLERVLLNGRDVIFSRTKGGLV